MKSSCAIAFVSLSVLLLSGCGTLPESAQNDPVIRVLSQHLKITDQSSKRVLPPKEYQVAESARCRDFQGDTQTDVDVVYAKAMQTFGFRTLEEREFEARRMRGVIDNGFKHRAIPGAQYEMSDYATDGVGQRSGVWMNMRITKMPTGRSVIAARYCLPRGTLADGSDPYARYEAMVRATIR